MTIFDVLGAIRNILGSGMDVLEMNRRLKELIKNSPTFQYSENDSVIVARALHKMQTTEAPHIAVIGMVSAGKSSLINALFGKPIAEVKRTADTTKEVFRINFPSGLILYDTPGILGDALHENYTRLFLGLEQDKDLEITDTVPFIENFSGSSNTSEMIKHLEKHELREYAPIDTVLWVVDISRVLSRPERALLRTFFLELQKLFQGHVVVAGTHIDILTGDRTTDRDQMITAWAGISDGQLIPVSSTTGEGLSILVTTLFRNLKDTASISKLQEALTIQQKLNRITFVVTEVSKVIAGIVLLNAEQKEEIQVTSVLLFSLLCDHYSVDERTWAKYNGDAVKLADHVRELGTRYDQELRLPKTTWERVRTLFGTQFFNDVVKYKQLGMDGLYELIPRVYRTLYEFEGIAAFGTAALTDDEVIQKIASHRLKLENNLNRKDAYHLNESINQLFVDIITPQLQR